MGFFIGSGLSLGLRFFIVLSSRSSGVARQPESRVLCISLAVMGRPEVLLFLFEF